MTFTYSIHHEPLMNSYTVKIKYAYDTDYYLPNTFNLPNTKLQLVLAVEKLASTKRMTRKKVMLGAAAQASEHATFNKPAPNTM